MYLTVVTNYFQSDIYSCIIMLHFRTFTYSMCAICTHICTLLVHFTRTLYTYLLLKIHRVYVYQLSYFMLCICLMLPTIKSMSIIKEVSAIFNPSLEEETSSFMLKNLTLFQLPAQLS